MPEIGPSGSMSGMWKRSHGRTRKAPPDERGGNGYVRTYRHRATSRLYRSPWLSRMQLFSPLKDYPGAKPSCANWPNGTAAKATGLLAEVRLGFLPFNVLSQRKYSGLMRHALRTSCITSRACLQSTSPLLTSLMASKRIGVLAQRMLPRRTFSSPSLRSMSLSSHWQRATE